MAHLTTATLIATLAAGFLAIAIVDRRLRERAPALGRAMAANLVLFNLLTAIGLGYRLAEMDARGAPDGGVLHLMSALTLALVVLKMAWLGSFGEVAHSLGRQGRGRLAGRWLVVAAAVAAAAALLGWVDAAVTGRLLVGLLVGLLTDLITLGGIVWAAAALWRESARGVEPAARRAARWFAAGNLVFVAVLLASFGAGLFSNVWRGAVQVLAHAVGVLVYQVLLVGWAIGSAEAWAEEAGARTTADPAFDRLANRCGLSRREREVAALLCRGRTNQEIADALFVALQTVKDHNSRIFQKVGVRNRTEFARRVSVLEPPAERPEQERGSSLLQ